MKIKSIDGEIYEVVSEDKFFYLVLGKSRNAVFLTKRGEK